LFILVLPRFYYFKGLRFCHLSVPDFFSALLTDVLTEAGSVQTFEAAKVYSRALSAEFAWVCFCVFPVAAVFGRLSFDSCLCEFVLCHDQYVCMHTIYNLWYAYIQIKSIYCQLCSVCFSYHFCLDRIIKDMSKLYPG
jgi:hypothetical protein